MRLTGKIGIDNEQALKAVILLQMKPVVDYVVDEILESLKKNIDKHVYNSYSPVEGGYQRLGDDGGLRNLWENKKSEIKDGKVIGTVKEEPERLVTNADLFQHGSNYWERTDIRDLIAHIVIEGKSGDLFGEGEWRKPRDFWHPLIDKLDAGQVNKLIEKAFKKYKIKFVKIY